MGKTMDVKEKITKLREERGWTKRRLAKEAGLNESAVYNWYSERNYEPSREAIEDVCAAFGITLSEFFTDIEVDKLTEAELKLLQAFRNVPEEKQGVVITVAEALQGKK